MDFIELWRDHHIALSLTHGCVNHALVDYEQHYRRACVELSRRMPTDQFLWCAKSGLYDPPLAWRKLCRLRVPGSAVLCGVADEPWKRICDTEEQGRDSLQYEAKAWSSLIVAPECANVVLVRYPFQREWIVSHFLDDLGYILAPIPKVTRRHFDWRVVGEVFV